MVNATAVGGVVETAQSYFYSIIIGIVILLIGFGAGVLAKRIVHRVLREIELNKIMSKVGMRHNLERTISIVISYLIYIVTIIIFLKQFGVIPIYIVYLIVGAILMLMALTFIVGLKDVIPNFVAWVLLQRKGKIKEGYHVNVREIYGVVERVGFLETEIKTDNNDILYVPNSLFLKSKFRVRK